MISGYAQNGLYEDALKHFSHMQRAAVKADQATFTIVLSVCGSLAILELGKELHGFAIKRGAVSDLSVGNALVTMYAKCGNIAQAREVFNKLGKMDVVSWNSMIAGYAQHGYGKEALELSEHMKQLGIEPDGITLVSVLTACNHTGLVDKGRYYFYSMINNNSCQGQSIMPVWLTFLAALGTWMRQKTL